MTKNIMEGKERKEGSGRRLQGSKGGTLLGWEGLGEQVAEVD
jgi:hypothetical protein